MVAVKELADSAQAQANTAFRASQTAVAGSFRTVRDAIAPAVEPISTAAESAYESVQNILPKQIVDVLPSLDDVPTPQQVTTTTFDFAEKALASQRELADRIAEFLNPEPVVAPAKKAPVKKTTTKKKATAKKTVAKKTAAKKTAAKK